MAGFFRKRPSGARMDRAKANRALKFFTGLKHTKGQWAGMPFQLMPWQHRVLTDVYGTVKPNGCRQYRDVYIEIPKKNGKSEFAGGFALYETFADGEKGAEVYGAGTDQQNAGIVYAVAAEMVRQSPALTKRCKIVDSTKRIVVPTTNSFYRVLSSEAYSKHGYNVSGLVVDEVHAHPTRELIDVLTKGTGAARQQPLRVYITTAGTSRESICWEMHQKARGVLNGTIDDPEFYPVIFGPPDDEYEKWNWESEANWKKVNPALGTILDIQDMRHDFREAKRNIAEEDLFKQLRLNIWIKAQLKRWMDMKAWDACSAPVDPEKLRGRQCYTGVDLSSRTDLTAAAYVFPCEDGTYDVLMHFWTPEASMELHSRRDQVDYNKWVKQGFITATEGNVIDYDFVQKQIEDFAAKYQIQELGYDSWNATQFANNLMKAGFNGDPKGPPPHIIEERQGYKTMSEPTKELLNLALNGKIRHGGHPVLRWNMDNLRVRTDPNANVAPDKDKSTQKIDGAVALIMALDRAIKHKGENGPSIYETQEVKAF